MRRYFTLDEVNALIPQIAPRMDRVLQLHAHLRSTMAELQDEGVPITVELLTTEDMPEGSEEVEQLIGKSRLLYASLRDDVIFIEALGAEVKDVQIGLVDFLSLKDGLEEVSLCWKVGEKKVSHYHDERSGYAGRRPVDGQHFTDERRPTPEA